MATPNDPVAFAHGETSLTRFPPNVERISVEVDGAHAWLVTRRNDVELRFPLVGQDCRFLAAQLTVASERVGDRTAAT